MPDHERCVCGWPGFETSVGIACEKCLWRAPSWAEWDRVMGAARELEQVRALYAEQTADARRMSTKLDRIAEVMDE
jgi:hypothetical protein